MTKRKKRKSNILQKENKEKKREFRLHYYRSISKEKKNRRVWTELLEKSFQ